MQQPLGGPRSTSTVDEVADTLALEAGVKVRHGVDVLTAAGVLIPDLLKLESGSVTWAYRPPDDVSGTTNEAAEVRRTAEITIVGGGELLLETYRFRAWTEMLSPLGNWLRFNLFYGVTTTPPLDDDGIVVRRHLVLAEKTSRYARPLLEPVTVPAGTNVVQYVIDSLGFLFGETSFLIPASSVTTTAAKTFPADGTTWLQLYNALFEVAAYDQLTVDEDLGRPRSIALADIAGRGKEITYGAGASKIVVAGSVEPLLPSIPNVVRFVARKGPSLPSDGNGMRVVTNQSTGPASVDSRGGDQVVQTVMVDAENQTQLDAVAAADAQRYFAGGGLRYTGHVALNPLHSDRDVGELVKPRLGLTGTWFVTSWTYPLHKIDTPDDVVMPITLEKKVG